MGPTSITSNWRKAWIVIVLLVIAIVFVNVMGTGKVTIFTLHSRSAQRFKWQGMTVKLQDENLLGKRWDKELFHSFVEYKNMKPYSNKNGLHDMGYTSYNMSEVQLISHRGRSVQVGDILQYRIQSRDFNGRNRITGGDFWYALLTSNKNPKASMAGYILDHGNGTYDAFLLAAWAGTAQVNIILVHVADAVYYIKNVLWNTEQRAFLFGHYQVGGKSAEGVCTWQRYGNWTQKCEYPAYNAIGGTVFLCDYKPGFPCDSIVSVRIDRRDIGLAENKLRKGVEFLFERPYYWQDVPLANATLNIQGSKLLPRELPQCRADQKIPRIQGYWLNGRWNSLLCKFNDWLVQSKLQKCLRNREVVILGDSTSAQVRDALLGSLGRLPSKNIKVALWSKAKYDTINATVYFQFHPYVFGSGLYKIAEWKSEVDVLDELKNADCNYIIMLGQWAHFSGWSRDSYIERIRLIRKAVINLHQRCPNVPVVIKGPQARHPRPKGTTGPIGNPDCLHKEMEYMIREAFEGIGAFFMPVWDLKLSSQSPNNIHMPKYVIMEELRMFMGYACDSVFPNGP